MVKCSYPDALKRVEQYPAVWWQSEGRYFYDDGPSGTKFREMLERLYATYDDEFSVEPRAIYALPKHVLYEVAGQPVHACCDVRTREVFFHFNSSFETMVHEMAHLQHPGWSEGKVRDYASLLTTGSIPVRNSSLSDRVVETVAITGASILTGAVLWKVLGRK